MKPTDEKLMPEDLSRPNLITADMLADQLAELSRSYAEPGQFAQ